jgi:glycerol-3-phosphate O-acyltransferase
MNKALEKYEPSPALAWLYDRFFRNIEIDETWAESVRDADSRGTVVYVLRNLSFVDFFALDYLTKRLELPEVRFANDLGLSVLEPLGKGWRRALEKRTDDDQALELRRALEADASAVLFLKRPPAPFDLGARAKSEGDKLLSTVLSVQRQRPDHPILLVPQVFVWSRNPDLAKKDPMDMLFGPREWPGKLRTLTQFLMNYRHVALRAGEPIDVSRFIEKEGDAPTDVLVRRLTYALLRRLERERQAVLGPVKKPDDRLREEVLRSPKLRKVISDMAGEGDAEQRALGERADAMLQELEAHQDVNAMKLMEVAFDSTIKRMYSAFEIDEAGLENLRKVSREGTLVLLPSHKSHVDYIILTWIFYSSGRMPPPLIAAGDNLSFFPLGPVLRAGGAFFIRRSFKGDRLYGAVVDAYVRRLIKDGFPLEFFLEGGRSRTGKLLSPKLGLLGMVVDAAQGREEKVYFCPISIGYERLVEEESYVREVSGGEKHKEDVGSLAAALEPALRRYGKLNVQFGEPITLAQLGREMKLGGSIDVGALTPPKRRALISRLAHRVMNEINRVTAVTPSALVATAILTHSHRGISHPDLVDRCVAIGAILKDLGARFSPTLDAPSDPGGVRRAAILEACDAFVRDGRVKAHNPGAPVELRGKKARAGEDAIYTVLPEARMVLDLSKNLLVHFFLSRALVATALVPQLGSGPVPVATLRERVLYLSRLFKYEFSFRADASFERIFDETLLELEQRRAVAWNHAKDVVSAGKNDDELRLYAAIFLNFVEGYRVTARSLGQLVKAPLAEKELEKRALDIGERMYHADEIARREAVSRPLFANAILAFVEQGYLSRNSGKLVVPESFASAEALKTVEARIASYVSR